jgi:hypothetical protein
MKGAHFDNGSEFINKPLLEWRLKWSIEPTRSRPYKKNDNCLRISGPSGAKKL